MGTTDYEKKYIRTNYPLTGNRIDYGDVIGMKTSYQIASVANRIYYTIMSGSTGMGLGAGFNGSILLFAQQILEISASTASGSQLLYDVHPLVSGVTYLGILAHWLSHGASAPTSLSAETVTFRYTILVVSR